MGAVGFEPTYPMEWAVKDLHLRSLMATDLQSALVDYLSNCPNGLFNSINQTEMIPYIFYNDEPHWYGEESVRFELTDDFSPSVFKTDGLQPLTQLS